MFRKIYYILYKVVIFALIFCSPTAILGQDKYSVKIDQNKLYIEKIYKNISGFGINGNESKFISDMGGNSTYGEITYESVENLAKTLNLNKKSVFYDLGCGVGKAVLQVYLNFPVKKSVGVELSKTRIEKAAAIKKQVKMDKKLAKNRKLKFYKENMTKISLKDATAVYLCSTCFSDQLMSDMANKIAKECKKGTKVATLRALPEHKSFKKIDILNLPMTWSSGSSVYIYEKIS
ncbi:methyltransferase domain-containing protein [Candidatus Babeliales bacterium]|nr:methyltransferase domain-containing protein [Candidatus Babeliales bacterium]MCF7899364.1 methyltransferase domain-containing protein [Candidatus Babeliales bacterium]